MAEAANSTPPIRPRRPDSLQRATPAPSISTSLGPPRRPDSLQVPTSEASMSRWSRTTYSLSIYEEGGFNDNGSTAVERSSDSVSLHAGCSAPDNSEEKSKWKKWWCTRWMWIVFGGGFCLVAIALIVLFVKLFGHQSGSNSYSTNLPAYNGEPSLSQSKTSSTWSASTFATQISSPPSTPSSWISTTNPSSTPAAETSSISTTTASSSAVAIVQVATEVMITTVGTLTESAAYPSSSS